VLTNFYWEQGFADNSMGLVAGVVDVSDYIDVYGLINVWTEFTIWYFPAARGTQYPIRGSASVDVLFFHPQPCLQ